MSIFNSKNITAKTRVDKFYRGDVLTESASALDNMTVVQDNRSCDDIRREAEISIMEADAEFIKSWSSTLLECTSDTDIIVNEGKILGRLVELVKKIFAAIKKVFVTIGEKIKAFFQKISGKKVDRAESGKSSDEKKDEKSSDKPARSTDAKSTPKEFDDYKSDIEKEAKAYCDAKKREEEAKKRYEAEHKANPNVDEKTGEIKGNIDTSGLKDKNAKENPKAAKAKEDLDAAAKAAEAALKNINAMEKESGMTKLPNIEDFDGDYAAWKAAMVKAEAEAKKSAPEMPKLEPMGGPEPAKGSASDASKNVNNAAANAAKLMAGFSADPRKFVDAMLKNKAAIPPTKIYRYIDVFEVFDDHRLDFASVVEDLAATIGKIYGYTNGKMNTIAFAAAIAISDARSVAKEFESLSETELASRKATLNSEQQKSCGLLLVTRSGEPFSVAIMARSLPSVGTGLAAVYDDYFKGGEVSSDASVPGKPSQVALDSMNNSDLASFVGSATSAQYIREMSDAYSDASRTVDRMSSELQSTINSSITDDKIMAIGADSFSNLMSTIINIVGTYASTRAKVMMSGYNECKALYDVTLRSVCNAMATSGNK